MKEKALLHTPKHRNDIFSVYCYEKNNAICEQKHFHKNYEILIVEKGSVSCIYDEKEYVLACGDAILFHPFQVHCFHLNENSRLFCMSFSRRFCVGVDGEIKGKIAENPVFTIDSKVREFILDRIYEKFGKWTKREFLESKEEDFVIKSATYSFGAEYVSNVKLQKRLRSVYTVGVEVAEYISINFKNNISLRDVAVSLGYNYQYLSRVFNKVFETGFKQMLNVYRMEQAIMWLTETNIPISDVAFESGFQSIRSLNAVCMEIYKKTPTELRNSREKDIIKQKLDKRNN